MAHIKKLTDKPRTLPWRAHINRKGHGAKVKMFLTKGEAEQWADEQERSIRLTGLPLGIEALKQVSVREIVKKYLDEKTPEKGSSESEKSVLQRFLKHPICKHSLASIERKHAQAYKNERLKDTWKPKGSKGPGKPITPRTVAREVNSIRNIFTVAEDEWGYKLPQGNPFSKPKIKGSSHRRRRRLLEGELERLEQACKQCRGLNRYYVPLAIYLAIETGMRLQEIFNLTWEDIDFKKRTIDIRKSKTDDKQEIAGRTIVLTFMAMTYLSEVARSLQKARTFKIKARIFPMTKDAFEQSWDDVLKRAKIEADRNDEVLQFRDLRREAGSRFDEAGLTKRQNEHMLGHSGDDTNDIYVASELKLIRDKLDRHALGGKTLDEIRIELAQWAKDGRLQQEAEQFARDRNFPIEMRRYYLGLVKEVTEPHA